MDMDLESDELSELLEALLTFEQGNYNYKCFYCEKPFGTEDQRTKHLTAFHPTRDPTKYSPKCFQMKCTYCDLEFPTDRERDAHIHIDHFNCSMCSLDFNSRSEREQHIVEYHTFKCPFCVISLLTYEDKSDHIRLSHSYKCDSCVFVARSEEDELLHMICKHFMCKYCRKTHSSVVELDLHMFDLHTFECDVCNEVYITKKLKDDHFERKHSFKCEMCKETFITKDNRTEHVLESHTFKCNFCELVFRTNDLKLGHILYQHHFKCIYCQKVSFSEEDRAQHILEVHTFKCTICPLEFPSTQQMELHFTDEHDIKCVVSLCKTIWPSIEARNAHVEEMHTFKCNHCYQSFNSEEKQQQHMRRNHRDKNVPITKKTNSLIPNKSRSNGNFVKPPNVQEHFTNKSSSSTHTQNDVVVFKSFKCETCTKIFNSIELRRAHVLNEHYVKCVHCDKKFPTENGRNEHEQICFDQKNVVRRNQAQLPHVKPIQVVKTLWACNECSGTWPTEVELDKHCQLAHVIPKAVQVARKLRDKSAAKDNYV